MSEREPAPSPPKPQPAKKEGFLATYWPFLVLAVALVIGVLKNTDNAEKYQDVAPLEDTVSQAPLRDEDMSALADAVGKAWAGESVDRASLPARLAEPGQSVYVAFRAGGNRLEHVWVHPDQLPAAGTMWDVLLEAIDKGKRGLGDDATKITRLEIDLTHSYRRLDHAKQFKQIVDEDGHKTPKHFGVRGMKVKNGDRQEMWSPTWQIAQNKTNRKQLDGLRSRWSMSKEEFAGSDFQSFEADQILVRLDTKPVEAVLMFRGNRIVDIASVDRTTTEQLATAMKDWLVNNLHPDGRLTYMIFPSTGKEDPGNNMIRQWMATNAMIRWAHDREDAALFDLVEKNIDHNVAKFYSQDGELGRINEDSKSGVKVKLGAVALAGMAMYTHPKSEKWATQITGIRAMVDHLWQEDGSFESFYQGGEKQQYNFYPGEALLFWATIYAKEPDPELLRKFKLSVAYFKEWHLDPKNRNPAFVPWHLQANYGLWVELGEDEAEFKAELVEYSFTIADWLVDEMQQWTEADGITYDDEKGRFYMPDPNRPFGVPHASSTGVYIEGLIDAWQFARDTGDETRKEKYRVALLRGIRSMMQLQFVDDVDMYYVVDPKPIYGGIRTTVFKNDVRCDNVQHPLMGIIKVLRLFAPADWADAS